MRKIFAVVVLPKTLLPPLPLLLKHFLHHLSIIMEVVMHQKGMADCLVKAALLPPLHRLISYRCLPQDGIRIIM